MAEAIAFENINITAAGLVQSFAPSNVKRYVLKTSGAIVLAGNVTLTDDGTWVEGMEQEFLWAGSATLGIFNITIFGYTLTQAQATAGKLLFKAYNTGGAYVPIAIAGAGAAQIVTADIADSAVTTAKINNLAVTTGKIANGAVDTTQLAAGAVTNNEVDAAAAIAYTKLNLSASIINSDIKTTAGIEVKKLEAMTNGQIITGNTGLGNIATVVPSGTDVVVANSGAMTIQNGVVTPEKESSNANTQTEPIVINLAVPNGKYSIKMGENFSLQSVSGINNVAIVGNSSIAIDINGTPVTGGTTSWTAADPINTQKSGTAITANNTGAAGATVNFTVTLAAGETSLINLSLVYKKTS